MAFAVGGIEEGERWGMGGNKCNKNPGLYRPALDAQHDRVSTCTAKHL